MVRIVQITDSHVTAAGTRWKSVVDTAARLRAAAAAAQRLAPDLVVHTGDVVETGAGPEGPAEYAAAADALSGLTAPLRLLPGNHDGRDAMRRAFPGQGWDEGPFLGFTMALDGLTLVGLDSVAEGRTGGLVCAARREWLAERLGAGPALVFMHHPPCPMGLPLMDGFGFEGGEALGAVLAARPVLRIACGHVHADVATHWAGTVVAAAEAVSVQIPPDAPPLGAAGLPCGTLEPLRLRVFDWDGARLSVKTVAAEPAEAVPL